MYDVSLIQFKSSLLFS